MEQLEFDLWCEWTLTFYDMVRLPRGDLAELFHKHGVKPPFERYARVDMAAETIRWKA